MHTRPGHPARCSRASAGVSPNDLGLVRRNILHASHACVPRRDATVYTANKIGRWPFNGCFACTHMHSHAAFTDGAVVEWGGLSRNGPINYVHPSVCSSGANHGAAHLIRILIRNHMCE